MSKPRGRPKQFDSALMVRLPSRVHDALCQEAHHRGVDVSQVARERLEAPARNTNIEIPQPSQHNQIH